MFWNANRHTSRGSIPTSGWTTSTCSRWAHNGSSRSTPRTPPSSSSQALHVLARLASVLELEGEHLKVATVSKYLGIDFSGRRTHRRCFHHKRTRAAIQRAHRIRFIKNHKGPAIKMCTACFLPSFTYGLSVMGASKHEVKRMRREMCASALTNRAGRCSYLFHRLRKEALPHIRFRVPAQNKVGGMDRFRRFPTQHPACLARIFAHISEAPQNRRWTYRVHHCHAPRPRLGRLTTRTMDIPRRHDLSPLRARAPLRSKPALPLLRGQSLGGFLVGS